MLVTRGGRRIALVEALRELPETLAVASITYAPPRLLDGIKSLSYGANMLATRLAKEAGADEAVLVTPHGRVLEAPTRAIFAVLGGTLRTPPLADHILDSITRRAVLSRRWTSRSAPSRSTSCSAPTRRSSRRRRTRSLPIHRVDDRDLPAAAPGPVTRQASERVTEHIVGGARATA